MMTSLSSRNGHSWRCWHNVLLMLVMASGFPVAASAAAVVKVWGAPAAAVQALRTAKPDIVWISDPESNVQPQLQLAWQLDAYPHALEAGLRVPVLVLSHQRIPASRLRQQDAALIWGPPLMLQVQLARRLMPLAKRIGVLYRASHQADITLLAQTYTGANLQIVPIPVEAPLTARALAEAADTVDVFVASNDDALFNRDSAKLILLTAYHHQRAIIGPTPAFVQAGAVATEAVPKAALIQAIAARVSHWQATGDLGASQTINHFAPVINAQVARSLSLIVPADMLREVKP